MKIELDYAGSSSNRIESYAKGNVKIAGESFNSTLLVSPRSLTTDWPPARLSELTRAHMEDILLLSPEVLILGTGQSLVFPDDHILCPLIDNQIGYEIMDTGAACRSFNYLLGEGREVVAALFMIENHEY